PAGFLVRPVPGASAPRTPAASTPAASIRAAAATAPPERWRSPLPGPLRLWRGFEPPEHPYGPGHRGIDLAPVAAGAAVVAPTDGSLFFAGTVVDRGVLTIRVDERTLLSVEPLGPPEPPPDPAAESDGEPVPRPGEAVRRGSVIGELGGVSHCAPAHCLHLGVRVDGEYVNPLPYFLGRPVLLPLE
ncbi:hypothetical protein, partial [Leucobacter sp. M11]|uniref:hypothetical protein n=1 Tax=Leucobacter sp. M11 TaxID=2993565 RepID=UPI002D7F718A